MVVIGGWVFSYERGAPERSQVLTRGEHTRLTPLPKLNLAPYRGAISDLMR